MKKAILLFFVFALSLSFADLPGSPLIDYSQTVDMGTMRGYTQSDPTYFTSQDVRYYLGTHLSIPSSQSERWLAGSGSYNEIQDGDWVCEGVFNYDTTVNARVAMGDFDGVIPSISASDNPNSWDNCGSGEYSSCPEGNVYVWWDEPIYGEADHAGRAVATGHYRQRSVTYEEVVGGTQYNNEVADVATIMEGTASLSYWRLGGYSLVTYLHTFDPLSGTQPSDDGSFSIWVTSTGEYRFLQRMDVDGATILTFAPDMAGNNEKVWSYDSMSMSLYTRSNIHDSSDIHVVDEDDVGVIPPSIIFVDMGNDGIIIGEPPYQTEPGAEIPVKLVMWIPDRPDDFFPLTFEFNNVGVSPSSFSFDEESGINQCSYMFPHRNGGWLLPYSGYSSDIVGTLTVPSSLGPGVHPIQFRVHWQTCSGQEDCDGNGDDGWTDWVTVEIDIPDDELPDLVCEIDPIVYVDGINPSPEPFAPGQGVEEWRVTVTNIGDDDFIIPGVDSALCSMLAFNAYSSDGTGAYDPFYYEFLTSVPGSIDMGESVTFDIDGTAICVDETGQIEAEAFVNFLWLWYPECIPFTPVESNMFNNACYWDAPCGPPDGIEECEIIPSLVTNPDSEEVLTFDLYCDGLPCTGTVTWDTTEAGEHIGDMTANDSSGATVEIVTYTIDDVPEGSLTLEAAVSSPNNMECEALIVLEVPPPPEECTIVPNNVNNPPSGSVEEFDLFCDGLPCTGTVTWDEEDGGDNVADVIASDQLGATAQVVTYTEPDELSGYMLLEATIDFPDNMVCNATITLNHDGPPDDDDCGLRCDIYPSPQLGAPGSYHRFYLQCEDDESDGWYPCGADDWDLTEGEEYVVMPWDTYGDQWADVYLISSFIIEEEGEIVEIEAFVDHGDDCTATCTGIIELPPMDCFDYI